jgi:hypothetical protein
MRIFALKQVDRFVRQHRISDEALVEAADQASQGIYRADLGGEVFKVDIARPGRGKSHGFRTLIGLRAAHRAVYQFAYAKNEFENVAKELLQQVKHEAQAWLNMHDSILETAK